MRRDRGYGLGRVKVEEMMESAGAITAMKYYLLEVGGYCVLFKSDIHGIRVAFPKDHLSMVYKTEEAKEG